MITPWGIGLDVFFCQVVDFAELSLGPFQLTPVLGGLVGIDDIYWRQKPLLRVQIAMVHMRRMGVMFEVMLALELIKR